MATETERKFLVVNVGWKFSCVASFAIRDGLIATEGGRKARVRINGSWIIGDFGGASRLSELGDDFIDEFLHFSSFAVVAFKPLKRSTAREMARSMSMSSISAELCPHLFRPASAAEAASRNSGFKAS